MRRIRMATALLAVMAALLTVTVTPAQAALPPATFAYGLTISNRLVLFNVNSPGTILRNVQITGLQPGENLLGIDVRPATGELYGFGSTGRLYVIDPVSGAATAVAPPTLVPTGTPDGYGFDFNPFADRIRLVDIEDTNARINPDTGAIIIDSHLAYAGTDPRAGSNPAVGAAAYTNNFPGSQGTTLYDIDLAADTLVIQSPPNNGTLLTVGGLGVNAFGPAGFDIVTVGGVNYAYASFGRGLGVTELFTIDLATGAATLVGTIAAGELVRDIAIAVGAAACTVPVGTAGVIFASPGTITYGTAGPDVICGTAGADRIAGLGGDDLILGLGGNDQLTGGDGDDTVDGGAGEDQLVGGAGNDTLFGGPGNDDLSAGLGADRLFGNAGADRLSGGEGVDDVCRAADGPAEAGDQSFATCETIF